MVRITRGLALAAMLVSLGIQASAGEKKYGPGVTDGEIKIGNTSPFSGPASAFSMVAKTGEAYFRKINAEGGINGRKINFISYDDGYLPPKTVEQTRKLVESDEVLLVFNALGDAGLKELNAFLDTYLPDANRSDTLIVNGYNIAQLMVVVLRQCGDDLTRENVMKQAASLNKVELGMLLPGIKASTSPTDFAPVKQWQLMRFEGANWQLFGDVINGETKD